MFETTCREDALELRRSDTEWLSTGWRGGRSRADALHSLTVPKGWEPPDLSADVDERLAAAGFEREGPVLLTGVAASNARGAELGPVEAVATAGVSNPAALPVSDPWEVSEPETASTTAGRAGGNDPPDPGTVNVVVGTRRALGEAALANFLTVAVEAKAATLTELVGVPGTTSDAVVAATDPTGEEVQYSGSATEVGAAARACVREAVSAALVARYPDRGFARSVERAEHGLVTDEHARVFEP
ncbi:MAG: adenosylcobinamide amidohydrolase [Halolamina sp.]